MLNLKLNSTEPFCDGLSRRNFLQIGSLGLGGLSLPQILQAEQNAKIGNSKKSIIMIYMAGAPPHQDLVDPKPDAPEDFRGDIGSIPTSIPGIHIGEMLPKLAKMMDKWTAIRSLYGAPNGSHDSFMCYTGRPGSAFFDRPYPKPPGNWPSIGSILGKLMGSCTPGIPPFVGLAPKAGHPPYGSPGEAGYLGQAMGSFRPTESSKGDMDISRIGEQRFRNRQSLLANFDQLRRDIDNSENEVSQVDDFTQQAIGVLTNSTLADALNLEKEDPKIREMYGKGDPKNFGDGAPRNNEHFLMARRLIEAGARCVTLNFGRWDFHSKNTSGMKQHAPIFDQGLSALIQDLHDRGMADDVSVVAWGEFGRTPKINKDAGRDHWPNVGCAFVAGGAMKTGQVIGSTDKTASEPADRPVHFGEVHATLYHNLGIDPATTTLTDLSGRPQHIVDGWKPMPDLAYL